MDKLKMQTENIVDENVEKIGKLFPNAVVEAKDENGKTTKMIDFDMLKQELSNVVVDGDKERYVMTWPDKKQAILTANAPISKTLRPCKEESVGKDGTAGGFDSENIYIEGDNLDVLKVLRETYLGKIKMIYIDPPYNTGNDFVYNDDFATSTEDYLERSNQVDEEGNRMIANNESNGRFHTDWLNMIYPRLKLAKDLLTEDGVIFISIDDNEQANLKKICDEIFGEKNFITKFIWEKTQHFGRQKLNSYCNADYIFCYAKNLFGEKIKELLVEKINTELQDAPLFNASNNLNTLHFPKGSVKFNISDGMYTKTLSNDYILENAVNVVNGTNENDFCLSFRSRWANKTVQEELKKGTKFWVKTQSFAIRAIYGDGKTATVAPKQILFTNPKNDFCARNRYGARIETSENATSQLISLLGVQVFSYPKSVSLINYFIDLLYDEKKCGYGNDFYVLDFFSGSATTAHATMLANAQDGGGRKFIMVQLPEVCDEKSEAYKAGYKNICEIGKERIRRAGKKIKQETNADIDYGFRVFKLDSSNMKDVYYKPNDYSENLLDALEENIKSDRSADDLLFQVMLDLGLTLDSKIEERNINGKKIFVVGEYNEMVSPDLICCFDKNIDNNTVIEIAKLTPQFAVFRDSSLATDSVATSVDQIFKSYSPSTTRKVL